MINETFMCLSVCSYLCPTIPLCNLTDRNDTFLRQNKVADTWIHPFAYSELYFTLHLLHTVYVVVAHDLIQFYLLGEMRGHFWGLHGLQHVLPPRPGGYTAPWEGPNPRT